MDILSPKDRSRPTLDLQQFFMTLVLEKIIPVLRQSVSFGF